METLQVIHVHRSSTAALTDFFTSSRPLAIQSIISDKCRPRRAWDISPDVGFATVILDFDASG